MRPCAKYSLVGCGAVKRYCATPPPRSRPLGGGNSVSRNGRIAEFTLIWPDGSDPCLAARVGTDVTPVTPRRSIKDSKAPKKKVRSLRMGPPITPPNWLRLKGGIGRVAG